MAIPLKGLEDLTGESAAAAIGFGLGVALSEAIRPLAEKIAQESWSAAPIRVPEAGTLASGIAQGQVDSALAFEWAKLHGFGEDVMTALVSIANTGPPLGQAMASLRRGTLTDDQFRTALHRAAIEQEWWPALLDLRGEKLEPAALATAIHRGIIAGGGLLIREPPLGEGKVPHVAQSKLDPIAEAAAWGYDPERLRVLVGNTGLPLALGEMLQLLNRDAVTEDDVRRSIAQSNVRNEYMDVALALRRQLPTARDYLENALRGYRTLDDAIAGAALHGMTAADATMIYQNQGRPMPVATITKALARGGKFKPEPGELQDPYEASIVEGNIKPAYYDLAKAMRYTLPGTFAIRAMAQAGDLTRAETEDLLLQSGWEPKLAAKVAGVWSAQQTGAGKLETKAELEDEYAGGFISESEFRAALAQLGYTGHVQDLLVGLNDARRVKKQRELVVKAISDGYVGGTYDRPTATARLSSVNVIGTAADQLFQLWDILREVNADTG